MNPTAPIPDALFLSESKYRKGRTQMDRLNAVLDVAEPWLGIDRSKGQKAWIRRQPGGWMFITNDPEDTIFFPLDSPLRGQDRYQWVNQPDGSRFGYLRDCARKLKD